MVNWDVLYIIAIIFVIIAGFLGIFTYFGTKINKETQSTLKKVLSRSGVVSLYTLGVMGYISILFTWYFVATYCYWLLSFWEIPTMLGLFSRIPCTILSVVVGLSTAIYPLYIFMSFTDKSEYYSSLSHRYAFEFPGIFFLLESVVILCIIMFTTFQIDPLINRILFGI